MNEQEKAMMPRDRNCQPSGCGMPAVPELRAVAEERLARLATATPWQARIPGAPEDRTGKITETVLHDLQVHQIELEMQNEELKRAQLAFNESRDKYLDLYDFAPVGYFTLTRSGQIAEVNLAGAAMLGLGRPKLIRRGLGGFVTPDDLNRWDQHLVSVLHSADKQTCELTLQREDGSTFCARLGSIRWDRPANEPEPGGLCPAIRVAVSDISDLTRVQRDLAASETKFRRLFEAAQDGILILDADSGRITEVNPFLISLTGLPRQELLGKTLWEIGAFKDVVANQDKFAELQQKEYVHYENLPLETADGRRIEVEFVSNVYLVNHHKVIQCNIRDISDRKQLQRDLAASETKFRRLFEAAQDGILILDADSGRITEVNPFLANLMGLPREEVLGKTLWEIGAFKDVVANQDKFAELQQKQYVRYENLPLETIDGRRLEVEFVSNVYLVNRHKVIQCNIRDISDRRKAHRKLTEALAQLARSNKELESFAYTASHDLKGPLITITGFLGRLAADTEQGNVEAMHSDVARIGEAARKMDRLLHDLLELSRIGRVVGSLEDVSLADLAREVARLLAGSIAERGVRVEISLDLPTVHGERARLTELFMNLLGNAVKFMGEQPDPHVRIGVRRDGEEAVCYVQDNGIGIDSQHKDRVFGLFQQLDPSRGGTGIGLAVAKRVVETHGGRIWLESDGPGKGSAFCFTLARGTLPVTEEEQENGRSLQQTLARVAG